MTTTPTPTTSATPTPPRITGAAPTERFWPNRQVLMDFAWRALVVDVATAAVMFGLPAWGRTPLSLAAALVTVLFFLRRSRRQGLLNRVLTAIAAVVVALASLGLLLNVLPSGLTTQAWGFGIGVLELGTLTALTFWRAPLAARPRRRFPVGAAIWSLLIVGVLAAALLWSISSFTTTHVAPLAMAAVTSSDSAVITISSGRDQGPYELQLVTGTTRTVLVKDIQVGPGGSASFTIQVPANTRETLELVPAGSTTALRKLILDTTFATKVTG